jgi:hypothetical protein
MYPEGADRRNQRRELSGSGVVQVQKNKYSGKVHLLVGNHLFIERQQKEASSRPVHRVHPEQREPAKKVVVRNVRNHHGQNN